MARKALSKEAIRILFAKTGNQCAFPGCCHPLVDDDNDFIAQVCHIEAANPGGERYSPAMTDNQRCDPSNLLVLCHRHHIKTNDESIYTAAVLRKMKVEHEAKWAERLYAAPEEVVDKLAEEELIYQKEIEGINAQWCASFDLAMAVRFPSSPLECLQEVENGVAWLRELLSELSEFTTHLPETVRTMLLGLGYDLEKFNSVPYYKSPIELVQWDMLNIGVPNISSRIGVNIQMLEVMLLYRLLKENPTDRYLEKRLDDAKAKLAYLAGHLGHAD